MNRLGLFSLVALCGVPILGAGTASAQSVRLDRFHAPGSPEDNFAIRRALVLPHKEWGLQLHVSYAQDPLVIEEGDNELAQVVTRQLTGTIGGAIGLFDRIMIYAALPATWQDGDDDLGVAVAPHDEDIGLSDATAGVRVRLLGNRDTKHYLSVGATVGFPTAGDDQAYRGDERVAIHGELLFDYKITNKVVLSLNGGMRFRDDAAQALNFELSNEVSGGVGLDFKLWQAADDQDKRLHGYLQAHGTYDLDNDDSDTRAPVEALAGLRFFSGAFSAGIAGGPGLTSGFGSPDFRVIGMLAYRPLPPRGPFDRDNDGVYDAQDKCPDTPEDRDNFEDGDGCPDPDNDKDGIPDEADKCPGEPGVAELQGCPDKDDDGDGLLNLQDACPAEPEDKDGFEDEDGCPDADNDKDGVADADDKCPMEPGPTDNKGCPESDRDKDTVIDKTDVCPDTAGKVRWQGCPTDPKIKLSIKGIEILEKVYFRTNRATIRAKSYGLLDQVARVIKKHPEIKQIIVEGHTDSRGSARSNKRLSQKRADAVVKYLVGKGVAADRLQAKGWGEERPKIERARTRAEHAQNRRVEFVIPKTEGVEQKDNKATSDTIDR